MAHKTDDLRVVDNRELVPPIHVLHEFPASHKALETVHHARDAAKAILHGEDDRLLVIVGPCSIHDVTAAMEYAGRLARLREELRGTLEVVMRVYFEKPRTTIGWKGLINDPDLNGSYNINKGIKIARKLLLDINELGVPTAIEFLDTISPQYTADLVTWGAVGARTTESQIHRELASGLSCPIGFKNSTSGDVKIAVDAVCAAAHAHSFLGATKAGICAIVTTKGNEDCHVILRGGKEPNYDAQSVAAACAMLAKAGKPQVVMVDASHANSRKIFKNQLLVVDDLAEQMARGGRSIGGVMIESNLVEGRQDLCPGKPLHYGQSITDACIGWDDTVRALEKLSQAVMLRRATAR